jgi:hypothetical protein
MHDDHHCLSRRLFLVRGLALAGALALPGAALGREPAQGILEVQGDARLNGRPAEPGMAVGRGDVLTTAEGARVAFLVGQDAFWLREQGEAVVEDVAREEAGLAVKALRLVTGAILGAFGPGEKTIHTSAVTAGIRGTAMYTQVLSDRTYLCLCYGTAELTTASSRFPPQRETMRTTNHGGRWLLHEPESRMLIVPAPFILHRSDEVVALDNAAGRQSPLEGVPEPPRGRAPGESGGPGQDLS